MVGITDQVCFVHELAIEPFAESCFLVFFNYFYEQNEMIANGSSQGIQLNFNTLGVINGIIDEYTQAPQWGFRGPQSDKNY